MRLALPAPSDHTTHHRQSADYLQGVLSGKNLALTAEAITKRLDRTAIFFDALAFRGLSGAVVASAVAMRMGKDLIGVRKGEDTHSCYPEVEGAPYRSIRYIILDDQIASGHTLNAIYSAIKRAEKAVNENPEDRYPPTVGHDIFVYTPVAVMLYLYSYREYPAQLLYLESKQCKNTWPENPSQIKGPAIPIFTLHDY